MEIFIIWKWLENVLDWLLEAFLYVPKKIFQLILEGLAGLIEAIPVPEFMANLGGLFSSMPSGMAYFLAPVQLGAGVTMILSAYVIRFIIRRLPVIG